MDYPENSGDKRAKDHGDRKSSGIRLAEPRQRRRARAAKRFLVMAPLPRNAGGTAPAPDRLLAASLSAGDLLRRPPPPPPPSCSHEEVLHARDTTQLAY